MEATGESYLFYSSDTVRNLEQLLGELRLQDSTSEAPAVQPPDHTASGPASPSSLIIDPIFRRGERVRKRVKKYDQLLEKRKKHRALFSNGETHKEPTTYQDALQSGDSIKWKEAMKDEFSSLEKNHTWTLTELPLGKNVVGCKWIYKIKYKPEGSVERYKARLVAKGYSQVYGVDFSETFSPVVKLTSIRILMALAAQNNL